VLDHQLGFALGYTVAAGAPALVLPAAGLALLWTQLPPGTQAALQDASLAEVQEWLVDHPEAVQHLVNGGGGLLEGLWDGLTPVTPGGPFGVPLLVPDTEAAAGLLAALYSDGHHQTSPSPLTIPGSGTAPADLAALVQHLAEVDAQPNGTVEVQTIRTADGSVRHVVYLPGTDDLTTTPWGQDADVRDLGTNLLLVSGQDNAYQQGILDAMQQAGVRPGEPVALVGHSQGGMEAAAILAQSSAQGAPYAVTHVVTAGAPTAHLDGFPPGSHVLSLENRGDVVPLLDGEDNPDSAEQVTVRFDGREATLAGSHDLAQYVHGALAVQASDDPSILEQLSSLESAGFVGSADGQEVTSQVFQITRVP
jgi:pimeloyl-ACP methyl ester carboxylesterase